MIVLSILLGLTVAEPYIQFVGGGDETYKIKCTDQDLSSVDTSGSSISISECIEGEECPELEIEGDTVSVTNFPGSAEGSTYQCLIGGATYTLMIGVISPPDPKVVAVEKKLTFDAGKEEIELAKCVTGYGQPAPEVVWTDNDGNIVSKCDQSNVDELNTNQCVNDNAENKNSNDIDLSLITGVAAGEGKTYFCEVTYWTAENGKKVEHQQKIKFPTEGCVSVVGAACPGDNIEGPSEEHKTGVIDGKSVSEQDDSEETDLPEEEEGGQMHNALLGTATGIVIFAIIVILIWFIRKKNREGEDDEQNTAGYKAGEQSEDPQIVANQQQEMA